MRKADSRPTEVLYPEDLECVCTAFELTLRYINENQSAFDVQAAKLLAADVITARALAGEHDAYRLWIGAMRHLQSSNSVRNGSGDPLIGAAPALHSQLETNAIDKGRNGRE